MVTETLTLRQQWYREEYLTSQHWKSLRESKLQRNPSCEKCGSRQRLDVHHLRYRNIFDVELSDLQTLCRLCHDAIHHPAPLPHLTGPMLQPRSKALRGAPYKLNNAVQKLAKKYRRGLVASIRSSVQGCRKRHIKSVLSWKWKHWIKRDSDRLAKLIMTGENRSEYIKEVVDEIYRQKNQSKRGQSRHVNPT